MTVVKKKKSIKRHEKYTIKRKLKFENYKNYLKGTQLENKINYLGKIKLIQIVSFVTKII